MNDKKQLIMEEYEWKISLAKIEKGTIEVRTPVGLIDVLSDTTVYEVKNYRKWKSALGQVLAYGYFYPSKNKKLFLYGKTNEKTKVKIKTICNYYKVKTEFADFDDFGFTDEITSVYRRLSELKAELKSLKISRNTDFEGFDNE